MKKLQLFALLFLGLSITMTFNACSDDDDDDDITPTTTNNTATQKTIAQLAVESGETDSLVVALAAVDLVSTFEGSGNFTVFAPNNAAWAAYISASTANSIAELDSMTLRNILLYHVLGTEAKASSLSNQMYVNTLNQDAPNNEYNSLFIEVNGANVDINRMASVVQADIDASNGVIHLIDNIINTRNVVDFAVNDDRFDSLVVALAARGLVANVQNGNSITVFAPTNQAFENLVNSNMMWNQITDIRGTLLDSVLTYHVYGGGNVQSDELGPLDGQAIPMLGSGSVTIDLTNGAQLRTTSGQTVDIIITDVQGKNGVIHAIDEVLLP